MSIGDLLGLIFLIIFVVGPVLRGLGRENPAVVPPADQPQEPSAESELSVKHAEDRALPRPVHGPGQGFVEGFVVEEFALRQPTGVAGTAEMERQPGRPHMRQHDDKLFGTSQMAIMNGVVWHQILSPPVALQRRKRRNERR